MVSSRASRFFDRVDQREFAACQAINRSLQYRPIQGYFRIVSWLGDGWLWYGLILALPVIDPNHGLADALLMVITGILCTLTYKALKHWLVRERPFISFPSINCGTPPLDRYSFPSGHTLHAVCFTTVLAELAPDLALILLPFTLSVAASRVVLGLHYPSDVAAGATIGAGLALASVSLLGNTFLTLFAN